MTSALVCATGPPRKGKSVLSHTPFPKLNLNSQQSKTGGANAQQVCTRMEQMLREIQTLRAMQAPFGKVFWFLEQKIAALDVEIERTRA
jgi:hypothetical protein